MKSNMLLLKLLLILFFNFIKVDGRRFGGPPGIEYLNEYKHFFCTHIASTGGDAKLEALFNIIVESMSMNDSSIPIPDIPIFIFRNTQLKKFDTNFDFSLRYGGYFWIRDDLNTLNVTVKEQFAKDDINYFLGNLETSKFNNADGDSEVLVKFDVKENGMYCAVIGVPRETEKLRTKEYAFNSHGYLPYQIYITLHSQLIYCIILTLLIGLMGYTFYQYGKAPADAAYEGFDSSSVALVFQCFFYFVYIPKYISTVIRYAFYLGANNDSNGSYDQKFLFKLLDMVDKLLDITNHYFIFLLAAGFGSFYSGLEFGYTKPSTSSTSFHTPMPARFWNRGVQFFVLNIVCALLLEAIDKYGNKIHLVYEYFDGVVDGDKHLSAYYFVTPLIDFLNVTFPLLWMSTSVAYYLHNLTHISSKAFQSETTSNQYLVKVVRSYRSSIVPILIIPAVFSAISLGIVIKQVNSTGKKFINGPQFGFQRVDLDSEETDPDSLPNNSTYAVLKLWINYLAALLSMIFTYIFWMKDNVGVKLLSRIGSTEYNQIPMVDYNYND